MGCKDNHGVIAISCNGAIFGHCMFDGVSCNYTTIKG